MKKRRTLDERGLPVVEFKNRDGLFERELDHSAIRKLDGSALELEKSGRRATAVPGKNPYGSVSPANKLRQRSSLDYLRALSEEIKRKRDASKK
jgi:hypothetical protein